MCRAGRDPAEDLSGAHGRFEPTFAPAAPAAPALAAMGAGATGDHYPVGHRLALVAAAATQSQAPGHGHDRRQPARGRRRTRAVPGRGAQPVGAATVATGDIDLTLNALGT